MPHGTAALGARMWTATPAGAMIKIIAVSPTDIAAAFVITVISIVA